MVQATWEKKPQAEKPKTGLKPNNFKFILGGLIMLGAVAYLIFSGTATGARYFITVEEVNANADYVGKTVRISGAVLGDTIVYDSSTLSLDFTIVNIPENFDNLAQALHEAVNNPNAARVAVHMDNEVIPDLLQHEAQAILTGEMGADGIFYATELLLKCPSRYEENVPSQALTGQG